MKRFATLPPQLDPIDPPTAPVKTPAEIEADFIARGEPVPAMVALMADRERHARLVGVWRVFTGQNKASRGKVP